MYIRSITEQAELIMSHLRAGKKDGAFLANHARMIVDLATAMPRVESKTTVAPRTLISA
jgi:hypothetical protein